MASRRAVAVRWQRYREMQASAKEAQTDTTPAPDFGTDDYALSCS